MCADRQASWPAPREGFVPVEDARLYYREIGRGQPLVILHGGPDFDQSYLLPEMDRLCDAFRLVYYDQRGRGRSAGNVRPEEVSISSEIADLEGLREWLRLEYVAILGHSWGGLLALEYALRHPDRVSRLILMNTAPASADDHARTRQHMRQRMAADDAQQLAARASDPKYREGDPDTVARYYRSHFRAGLRRPEHLDRLIARLRASFTREGILKARQIEDRLMEETWLSGDYDLLPKLGRLRAPTLLLHGEADFIPVACAAHIAQAIPEARLVVLRECGHFAYLERPDEVRNEIAAFFHGP